MDTRKAEFDAGFKSQRIAVVREAFAGASERPQSLASLVASLPNDSVAVASDATLYHRRLLVDEYLQGKDGKYALTHVATDLFR